jgi:hypothetical protein
MMRGVPGLDSTTASRLVRLRALLLDAQAQAADRTEIGRHRAVVALDGVVELAVSLALHERGVDPPRTFPDALEGVLRDLGDERPDGWKGMRELHRTRNLVQHDGVLPDAEQVALWSPECERFVRSLIASVFHIDLSAITSAAAVEHEPIRSLLNEAEAHLDADRPREAFDKAWEAMEEARRVWSGLRLGTAGSLFFPSPPRPFDELVRPLEGQIRRLETLLEIATFTADPSEFMWLSDQREESQREGGAPPSINDARRAMSFVLAWVLRLEAFVARHPADRWREWYAEQRAPKTGRDADRPTIVWAELVEERSGERDRATVMFQLADLPDVDDESEWMSALYAGVRSMQDRQAWPDAREIRLDTQRGGRLVLSAPSDTPVAEMEALVDKAISGGLECLRERATYRAQRDRRRNELMQPYVEALASLPELPGLAVTVDATIADDRPGESDQVTVRVNDDEGEASSRLDQALAEGVDRWRREHGGLNAPGPSPRVWSGLTFPVGLVDPADVARLMEAALPRAREISAAYDREQRGRAVALERLAGEVRRRFGQRGG